MAENGYDDDIPECPLCLEPLSLDDLNFYPCSCRYQICRFCWHRIRTDENGLCPHCRDPYSENPAEYTPPTSEQMAKMKSAKRQKTQEKKLKLVESRKSLASVRVVQKNLVFVIGLSPRLADPETLRKNEYFGKYGKIYKVVINNSTVYSGAQGPSVSAYVTYYKNEDASKAIQAVNNAYIDGRYLKASFGTTKYCTYFLRGTQCTKPDCMYLHELGEEEASFTKEDMAMGKHQVYESAQLAAVGQQPLPPSNPPVTVKKPSAPQRSKEKEVPYSSLPVTNPSPTAITVETDPGGESALPATASWATTNSKAPEGSDFSVPSSNHVSSSSTTSRSHSHTRQDSSGSGKNILGSRHFHKSHSHPHGHPTSKGLKVTKTPSPSHITATHTKTDQSDRSAKSGPLSPNSTSNITCPPEQIRRPPVFSRTDSRGSRQSSSSSSTGTSKSVSPSLSPKSSLSASSSSGSLNRESGGGEVKGQAAERDPSVQSVPTKLATQQEKALPSNGEPLPGNGQSGARVPETASRVPPPGMASNGEHSAMKVIESLGSAGSGQFGSLGVSWSTTAPEMTHQHHVEEDDLEFDPWDVSKQGLADLLQTEGHSSTPASTAAQHGTGFGMSRNGLGGLETEGRGSAATRGAVSSSSSSSSSNSWQEELRALFPNVNISFGGQWPSSSSASSTNKQDKSSTLNRAVDEHSSSTGKAFPSPHLGLAVDDHSGTNTAFASPHLGLPLGYPYSAPSVGAAPPTTTAAVTSSAFSNSYGFTSNSGCSEWPDLSASGGSGAQQKPSAAVGNTWDNSALSSTAATTTATTSKDSGTLPPPPPPGFTAKRKDTALSSSVNHALWGGTTPGKAPVIYPNHLVQQSWPKYAAATTLSATASQSLAVQQLAAYQLHLLRQQQLLALAAAQQQGRQSNPFLQAAAANAFMHAAAATSTSVAAGNQAKGSSSLLGHVAPATRQPVSLGQGGVATALPASAGGEPLQRTSGGVAGQMESVQQNMEHLQLN